MIGGIKKIFFAAAAALLLAAHVAAPALAVLERQSTNHNVNTPAYKVVGDLYLSNIRFINLTDSTVQGFGLVGSAQNKGDKTITYTSNVAYYNDGQAIVASSVHSGTIAPSETIQFTQMSPISALLSGYTASDITSYRFTVAIDYVEEEKDESEYFSDGETNKTPSKNPKNSVYGYVLDAYDVDVVVHDDNTYDVTEKITAYFTASNKHGIIRNLPLSSEFTHNDGTSYKARTKVSNITVEGDPYTTSTSDGELSIKIGSASRTVQGKKEYTIKYTYNFGQDKNQDYDEFYYNIIGTQWDTVIGNATFAIHMPKEFDAAKLGFSSGRKYSTDNESVIFQVKGNDITGSYNGILGTHEGITVRLTLDEGYFANAQSTIESWEYLIFIIPAAGAIVAFILWLIFGNDDPSVDDLQFYPPEGMNSLDLAYAYKGRVDGKDVVSLLLHLANQGYIKIVETSSRSYSSNNFKIVKMKEYDGKDENEEKFMSGLFKGSSRRRPAIYSAEEIIKHMKDGDSLTREELEKVIEQEESIGIEETTASRLRYSFYRTINKITDAMNKKENRKKYFTNTSFASVLVIISIIISVFAIIAVPAAVSSEFESVFILVILLAFYAPFFAVGFAKGMPLGFRIIWLGFTTIHFGAMIFGGLELGELFETDSFYAYGLIIGIACIVIQALFLKFMPKRTAHGLEVYGKIKGFKKFLETAEKDRLERLMAEKPSYAYDILPYAYVLGVSTKWMKKFEGLTMAPPDWYDGYATGFSMSHFNSFVNHTMTSSASAMTASPSSSGGGGFSGGGGGGSSGGGSSGGGGGGGGGSSW